MMMVGKAQKQGVLPAHIHASAPSFLFVMVANPRLLANVRPAPPAPPQIAQDSLQAVRRDNKSLQEQLTVAEGEAARYAVAAAEAKAAASAAAKAAPADGAATAALQQALHQLSMRTAEVVQLKKQLEAAEASGTGREAGGEAADSLSVGGSGPATPVVDAVGEGLPSPAAHAAMVAGGSSPASPTAAGAAAGGAAEASVAGAAAAEAHAAPAGEAGAVGSGGSGAEAASAGPAAGGAEVAAAAPAEAAPEAAPAAEAGSADAARSSSPPAAADLPQDLRAAHQEIGELRHQVAQLRRHLEAAAAAAHSDDDEEDSDEEHAGEPLYAIQSVLAPVQSLWRAGGGSFNLKAATSRRMHDRGQQLPSH